MRTSGNLVTMTFIAISIIFGFVICYCLIDIIFVWLWNHAIMRVFHAPKIGLITGAELLLFVSLCFGGVRFIFKR